MSKEEDKRSNGESNCVIDSTESENEEQKLLKTTKVFLLPTTFNIFNKLAMLKELDDIVYKALRNGETQAHLGDILINCIEMLVIERLRLKNIIEGKSGY